MRFTRVITRILRRRHRPPRGTGWLVADVKAMHRLTASRRAPAAVRLEQELGTGMLRELERELGLEGRLVPSRRRVRRAA